MAGEVIILKRFPSELDAQMARGVLECEGIPAIVLRDDAGGMEPQFQLTLGVRLMVRGEDFERAKAILGESK